MAVCVDITMNAIDIDDQSWSLGLCSERSVFPNTIEKLIIKRSCLAPGQYILTCKSTSPAGKWKQSFVEIQGHKYCNDFTGLKTFQTIQVPGNILTILYNNGSFIRIYI
jgi:hypothetical protein